MITEDEVMSLLQRADPARRLVAAPDADAAAYLDSLRARSSDVTLIDTEPEEIQPDEVAADRRRRPPWIYAVAGGVDRRRACRGPRVRWPREPGKPPHCRTTGCERPDRLRRQPGRRFLPKRHLSRRARRQRAATVDLDAGARRVRAHLVIGRTPPRLRANRGSRVSCPVHDPLSARRRGPVLRHRDVLDGHPPARRRGGRNVGTVIPGLVARRAQDRHPVGCLWCRRLRLVGVQRLGRNTSRGL